MQFNSINDFLIHVQKELDNNRLVLPSLPDVALKVREAVNKGDASAQNIADIITTDAVISARLIQVVNSPLYSGNTEIKSIQLAISRLGNKTIHTLVTSLAMRQLYATKSKALNGYFKEIWRDSVNVASISRALATFTPHLSADEAMLAGLMHQIGKLPILVLVENIPEFRDHPDRLAKLLEKAHRPIGKIIMTSWNVPENLKLVPSEYGNVNYDSDINLPATYVDVVQVAFFQSIARTQNTANNTNCDSLISFRKLGFSSETEILEIKGIPEIIKQTQSSLSL